MSEFDPNSQAPATNPKKGMAIASLVLGIVSIVLGACFWYISAPGAIVGLILGIMSNKAQKKGLATAGIVLCIIGLVWTGLGLFGLLSFLDALKSMQ